MKKVVLAAIITLGVMSACEEKIENACLIEPSGDISDGVLNFALSTDFYEVEDVKLIASGVEYSLEKDDDSFVWLKLPLESVPESLILKVGEESNTFPIEISESIELENGKGYIVHYYDLGVKSGKFDLVDYAPCNDDVKVFN